MYKIIIIATFLISILASCSTQDRFIGCDGIPRYSLEQPTDSLGV